MFLEHVNLTVSDLERSIDFYTRLFDFRVRWRGTTDGGTSAVHVGDDRCYLALFEAAHKGRHHIDYAAVGFNHFAFVVDDLNDMKQRLVSLGVSPSDEQDYEPGRRVYFVDPDGIEVELVQYTPAAV